MPPSSPKTKVSPKAPKATQATKAPKTTKAAKSTPSLRPTAEIRRVADLLKQASDPTRLQVLMLLNENERNVSELCEELGTQSQPAVSHHLALLRHGRLIEPRRSGKHNFYGLTDAGRELAEVVNAVID